MTDKMLMASYGMNTNPTAMSWRTAAKPIGTGVILNHKLKFSRYCDVRPEAGASTHVVLWEIDDEQLAELDNREGYPTYYLRKTVEVYTPDGDKVNAIMYYMTEDSPEEPPDQYYWECVVQGYEHFGLPPEQITEAKERSLKI